LSGVETTDGLFPLRQSLRFALVVQPRPGKAGNLIWSFVLVGVVVSDVGAPLLPALRGRLALVIMMGTVIVVVIGHRVVGRFEVVPRIDQGFQLAPVGHVEEAVPLFPQSRFALESREPRDIAGGSGLVDMVVPDAFTPSRQSFRLRSGRAGDGNGQSVDGESTDGKGKESDFGEHGGMS